MKRFFCILTAVLCLFSSALAELSPMEDRDDPIAFNVFIRDNSLPPAADNPVMAYIEELTGVKMNFEFLTGDLDRTLEVMIASKNYPDAIFAFPEKLISAGAYIPLEDMIQQHCPNLYAYYEPWWEEMKAEDGHIYVLDLFGATKYVDFVLRNENSGFWIQKRVLEFGGYTIPRTLDEYFDLIARYLEANPETNGEPTVGYAVLCDGWLDFCLRNPPMHLMGAGNEGDVYVDPDTQQVSLYQNTDTAKAYYRKLNDAYHQGILSAETMMQSIDQYLDLIASGRVLAMFDQRWNFSTAEKALEESGQYEKTYISLPITQEGVPDAYLDLPTGSFTGNNGLGITVNCEDPLRLLKFYDWLIQEDVQKYLYWGEVDKDYTVDENGRYRLTEERRRVLMNEAQRRDTTGYVLANYSPKMDGLYEPGGNGCDPTVYQVEEFKASLSEYDQAFLDAYGFQCYADFLSPPVQRPASYPAWSMLFAEGSAAQEGHDELVEVCRKYDPRLILCAPEDYDAIWEEFCTALDCSAVQDYIDGVQQQVYQRMGMNETGS